MQRLSSPPLPGSMVGRFVAGMLAALLLTGAFFVGAIFFVILLGVALVGGVVMAVRMWWFRRKYRDQVAHMQADLAAQMDAVQRAMRGQPVSPEDLRGGPRGATMDGEYRRED